MPFVSYRTQCARRGPLRPPGRRPYPGGNHMEEMQKDEKTDRRECADYRLASPAMAAEKYFVTVDTVGNCSIVQSLPGTGMSAGKKAIGNTDGYASMDDAKKYLDEIRNDDAQCKGVVAG